MMSRFSNRLWHPASIACLAVLILVLPLCSSNSEAPNCDCVTNSKGKPVAVVIGEDLSMSTSKFVPITIKDIESVCENITASGLGGSILFVGFGAHNPRDFAQCTIDPIPAAPTRSAIICVSQCRKEAANVEKNNRANISTFLGQCEALLKNRGQKLTDLNGFFEKSAKFLNDKDFSKYEKWLLCNSDGLQDLGSGKKKADCSLIPPFDIGYFSQWENKAQNCPMQKGVEAPLSPYKFFDKFKKTVSKPSTGKKKG